jgi:sigma-B regulation protein RsbU (phosphoserine phosphatase)
MLQTREANDRGAHRTEGHDLLPGSLKDCPPSEVDAVRLRVRGYLQITHHDESSMRVEPLTANRYLIGSGPEATIRLNNPVIAPIHAELVSGPFERWWIRDRTATAARAGLGIMVQGRPVAEHVLRHGEGVRLGPFTLSLRSHSENSLKLNLPPRVVQAKVTGPPSLHRQLSIPTAASHHAEPIGAMHLSMVMGLSRQLMDEVDAKERLRLLCRFLVAPPLNGHAAVTLRVEDDPREPKVLCGPFVDGKGDTVLKLSVRVLARLRAERGSAVVTSTHDDNTSTIICCALDADERHIDALYGVFPAYWEEPEWSLLLALVAEAYRQAELVWDMRRQSRENAYIERELEMARQIQLESMPRERLFHCASPTPHSAATRAKLYTTLDTAVGFEPCLWVGGDYVDALPLPDGRILLAVADVCGKGLQAALVASSLQTLVRATADQGVPLTELMERLNRHLCKSLPASSFATMLCLAVDVSSGQVEYCCAGHPSAIAVSADGSIRRFAEGQNVALGLTALPMISQRYVLQPEEILLMFTDGVTEMMNIDREAFGVERLEDTLRVIGGPSRPADSEGVKTRLFDALREFRGNALVSDDCTFVVAQRRGRTHPGTTLRGAHLI